MVMHHQLNIRDFRQKDIVDHCMSLCQHADATILSGLTVNICTGWALMRDRPSLSYDAGSYSGHTILSRTLGYLLGGHLHRHIKSDSKWCEKGTCLQQQELPTGRHQLLGEQQACHRYPMIKHS